MEIFSSCNASGGGVSFKILEAVNASNYTSNSILNSNAVKTTPVVLVGSAVWLNVPLNRNTISSAETPLDSSGSAYQVNFSLFVTGNEVENINAFEQLQGKRFLIDFTDNNDNRRLFGFSDEALKLSISFNVPEVVTGISGHALTFSGMVSKRAPKYDF